MKLVLFDLDGTLCNSLQGITDSLNRSLEQCNFPTFTADQVSGMVGKSVIYLCQRAMPHGHENDWEKVRDLFLADYAKHLTDTTKPYPGIVDAVIALHDRGYLLAVVTNKPHRHATEMISVLFPNRGEAFAQVQGQSSKFLLKPDPESLFFVMDTLGVKPEDAVYVGDSDVDLRFAENANLPFIGCAWGFRGRDALLRAGAKLVADEPSELVGLVESL